VAQGVGGRIPQQSYGVDEDGGGGGFGGFILSKLAWLDKPRAAVMSTLKEVTDLATGKGFSLSDWKDQVDRHYGFGEYQQEYLQGIENVAMPDWVPGLGGKKILRYGTALVGDVMTDPFMLAGGLSAYWRLSGSGEKLAKGLASLAKSKSAVNTPKGILAQQAATVIATNKNNVSAGVKFLRKENSTAAQELLADFGLDVGLRWRELGSGPILGGIGRRLLPERTARKLAQQVPTNDRRLLAEMTGKAVDSKDFDNLLAEGIRASWGDEAWEEVTKAIARGGLTTTRASVDDLVEEVSQNLARAGRVPIERAFVPKWISPKPVLPGLTVAVMATPGIAAAKISTSALGRMAAKVFVDPVTAATQKVVRSSDETGLSSGERAAMVHLGLIADTAQRGSSARSGIFVSDSTLGVRRWYRAATSPQGGFKRRLDDRVMGDFTDIPLETWEGALLELMGHRGDTPFDFLEGVQRWAEAWSRRGVDVPVDTPEDLWRLIQLSQMYRTGVTERNNANLLEIFGPDSTLIRSIEKTRRMSGDYTAGIPTVEGHYLLTRSDGEGYALNPGMRGNKESDEYWMAQQHDLADKRPDRTDKPWVPERDPEAEGFVGEVKGRFAKERTIHGPYFDPDAAPRTLLSRAGIPRHVGVDEGIARSRHPSGYLDEGWRRPTTEPSGTSMYGEVSPDQGALPFADDAVRAVPAGPDELLDAAAEAVGGPRLGIEFAPTSFDEIVESRTLIKPGREIKLGGVGKDGKPLIPADVDKMAVLRTLDPSQYEAQLEAKMRELLNKRLGDVELGASALKRTPLDELAMIANVPLEIIERQALDALNKLDHLTYRLQRGSDDVYEYVTREGVEATASLSAVFEARGFTNPVNRFGWGERQQLDFLGHNLRILDEGASFYVLDLPLREAMWTRGMSQDVHMHLFKRTLNENGILFSTEKFADLSRAYEVFMERMGRGQLYLDRVGDLPQGMSVDAFVRRITGQKAPAGARPPRPGGDPWSAWFDEAGKPVSLTSFIKAMPRGSHWRRLAEVYSKAASQTAAGEADRLGAVIRQLEVDSPQVRARMEEAARAVQDSVDDLHRIEAEIASAEALMLASLRNLVPDATLGDLFTEKLLESATRVARHIPDLDGSLIREWDVARWADITQRADRVYASLRAVREGLAKRTAKRSTGEYAIGDELVDDAARIERERAVASARADAGARHGVVVETPTAPGKRTWRDGLTHGPDTIRRPEQVAPPPPASGRRRWTQTPRTILPLADDEAIIHPGLALDPAFPRMSIPSDAFTEGPSGYEFIRHQPSYQIQVYSRGQIAAGGIPGFRMSAADVDQISPGLSEQLIREKFGDVALDNIEFPVRRGDDVPKSQRHVIKIENRHPDPKSLSTAQARELPPSAGGAPRAVVGEASSRGLQEQIMSRAVNDIERLLELHPVTVEIANLLVTHPRFLTKAGVPWKKIMNAPPVTREFIIEEAAALTIPRTLTDEQAELVLLQLEAYGLVSPRPSIWRGPEWRRRTGEELAKDPGRFDALAYRLSGGHHGADPGKGLDPLRLVSKEILGDEDIQAPGWGTGGTLDKAGINLVAGNQAAVDSALAGESVVTKRLRARVEEGPERIRKEAAEYADRLARQERHRLERGDIPWVEKPHVMGHGYNSNFGRYGSTEAQILDVGAGVVGLRHRTAIRGAPVSGAHDEEWMELHKVVTGGKKTVEESIADGDQPLEALAAFFSNRFPDVYAHGRPPKAAGSTRNYVWMSLTELTPLKAMERTARLRDIQLRHAAGGELGPEDVEFLTKKMGYRNAQAALDNIDDDVLVLGELAAAPHAGSPSVAWIDPDQKRTTARMVPGETRADVMALFDVAHGKLQRIASERAMDTPGGRKITAAQSEALVDEALADVLALGKRRRSVQSVIDSVDAEAKASVAADPKVPSEIEAIPWSERDLSVLDEVFETLGAEIGPSVRRLQDDLIPLMQRLQEQKMATDETVEAAEKLFDILGSPGPTGSFVKGASPKWGPKTVLGRYENIVDEVKRLEDFFGLRISGEGRSGAARTKSKKQSPKGADRPFGNLPEMQPFLREKLRKAEELVPEESEHAWAGTAKSLRSQLGRIMEQGGARLISPIMEDPVLRAKWDALAKAHAEVLHYRAQLETNRLARLENFAIEGQARRDLDRMAGERLGATERMAQQVEEREALPDKLQVALNKLLQANRNLRPDLAGPMPDAARAATPVFREGTRDQMRLFAEEFDGPLPGGGMLGANSPRPLIEDSTPEQVVRHMIAGNAQVELELAEIAYYSGMTEQMMALLKPEAAAKVRKRILDELASDPAIDDAVRERIVESGWLGAKARKEYLKDSGPDGPLHWMWGSDSATALDPTRIPAEGLGALLATGTQMWGANLIASAPSKAVANEWAGTVTDVLMAAQKSTDRDQVGNLLVGYDKVHNWMKAQLVATPGFVMRNLLGGLTNMWFKDIPPTEVIRTGRMMQKAYRAGDGDLVAGVRIMAEQNPKSLRWGYMQDLVNTGAHSGGQAASAVDVGIVGRSRRDFFVGQRTMDSPGARVVYSPLSPEFTPWAAVRHANTFAEEAMRLATGMHAMKVWGDSVDEALYSIHKLHFDYGKLSDFERKGLRRAFPFYTWTRNNLPLQVEFMAKHPQKYNRLFSLKREMERNTPEEGTVPHYFLEPFGIRLPFQISGAQIYSVPDTPFQDLLRYDPSYGGIGSTIEQVVSQATPIAKVPVEYWAGKQVFAGIPFTERYQQVPALMQRVPGLMHALQQIGWAKRSKKGEWKMQDNRIYLVGNLMPYIGVLQRAIPGLPGREKRKQERYISALISTLAGLSMRMNTRYEQESERVRREIERYVDRRDRRDVDLRTR